MRRGLLSRRNSTSAFILKGIYQALIWYVSGYKRRFGIEYLSVDLPGHSAELFPNRNYTIVSVFKEESYRANYSCAVDRFEQPDVLSNSVEVVFKGDLRMYTLHHNA